MYPLLLIFFSLHCMEKEQKIDTLKVTPSIHISYIEALMAGGNFCINTDSNEIEFKHFKKEKHFTFPINELENLTGAYDVFSLNGSTSDCCQPTFTKPCTSRQLSLLALQHRRLCKLIKALSLNKQKSLEHNSLFIKNC